MNIGIFTECYKPTINGVVMSIETFRVGLEKMGHQVFIFCPRHKGAEFQPNVFRVPSITLPSPKDYPIGIPYFSNLKSQISKLNLDIIHTQHIFLMGGFGQAMAKRLKIPTVHTYHTLMTEYTHYIPFFQAIVRDFIIYRSKKFCNRAWKIIVPSSPMIDVLRSYGVKKPIEVLPTGIKLKDFTKLSPSSKRDLLEKYKLPTDKKILLYVGRIAIEKNLDFLLRCFVKIKEVEPNCHLVLVGSGPYESNLKLKIKNLKLKDVVTFTGFLEKPICNQFFGAADIFVFPSITDTQGIVLVEAMASGCPSVAINRLGPVDIIKNDKDGFLTKLSEEEFTDKILKLLKDDKLRKNFGEKARKNTRRFAVENCAKKLIKIYQEVLNDFRNKNSTFSNFKKKV